MLARRLLTFAVASATAVSLLAFAPANDTEQSESAAANCWTDDAGTTDDTTDDTEFCELATWFHRASTPAGNVEGVAAETFPTWDTNPPAGSVTEGNGGGYMGNSVLDLVAPGDPNNAATFNGTFDGTLDNMAVTLYAWVPGRQAEGTNHNIHLMLDYAGTRILDQGDLEVVTTPDGDTAVRIDFVIDNLGDLVEAYGFDNSSTATHDLSLKIGSWNHAFDEAVWLYDTTEVPSGIVFNRDPAAFGDYTVVTAF